MKAALTYITLLFFLATEVPAQHYDFNNNCKTAYREIINLNFIRARQLIMQEKKNQPDNLIAVYLENTIDFLTLVTTENPATFNTLKSNKERRLAALEKGDKHSPYNRYCLAEVHLQWAAARIIFNEYLTAAYEINRAYRLLDRNHEKFPDFKPNLKSLGLINALVGTIPDNFRWIARIIGMTGTSEQGVNQMASAMHASLTHEEFDFLLPETLFLLTFTNLNLLNDEKQLQSLVRIIENNSEINALSQSSALINYALANLYMRFKGDNDKALYVLQNFKGCRQCLPFWYRTYLLGLAKLHNQDPQAITHFEHFVNNFRGVNNIKSAYQKMAWHYLMQKDTAAYTAYMHKVTLHGKQYVDADKVAQAEAEAGVIPNYYLLKARLLFDGAYYERALQVLATVNPETSFKTFKEALEFSYRMGRIYHSLNRETKALSFYQITIDKGWDKTYYYAANAALHMGYIYENMGDYSKAAASYRQAQNMHNTEYKHSIDQRAKAALNRITNER